VRADNFSNIQCGRVEVGSCDKEGGKTVDIKFQTPFPEGADVALVTTAHGEDWPDTFATCVRHLKRDRCSVQINRVGFNNGWGQNLGLFYIATTNWCVHKFTLGSSTGGETKSITKNFDFQVNVRPIVIVVPVHEQNTNWTDCFTASVTDVTNTHYQVNVSRLHNNEWGMNLRCMAIIVV